MISTNGYTDIADQVLNWLTRLKTKSETDLNTGRTTVVQCEGAPFLANIYWKDTYITWMSLNFFHIVTKGHNFYCNAYSVRLAEKRKLTVKGLNSLIRPESFCSLISCWTVRIRNHRLQVFAGPGREWTRQMHWDFCHNQRDVFDTKVTSILIISLLTLLC